MHSVHQGIFAASLPSNMNLALGRLQRERKRTFVTACQLVIDVVWPSTFVGDFEIRISKEADTEDEGEDEGGNKVARKVSR